MEGHFRAIAVALSSNEQRSSFFQFLSSVRNGIQRIHRFQWNVHSAMCDAALAIRNALKDVWPEIKIAMCWFHVSMNVKEKCRNLLPNEQAETLVKRQLQILHSCITEEQFEKACQLALQSWRDNGFTDFANYFENQWVHARPEWYCGFLNGHANTNCAAERRNREIKDHYTFHNKLPLNQFLPMLERLLMNWSRTDHMNFASSQAIPLKLETESCKLLRSRKFFSFNGQVICSGSMHPTVTTDDVARINGIALLDCQNFLQLEEVIASFHRITLDDDGRPVQCSCVSFQNTLMCKHLLSVRFLFQHATPSLEAWTFPIEQKRKRGRPKKVPGALVRENN
eukprot:GCRY01008342.1.p1 GENE.GCRY01008342.1~~GCRY01008342.1.p1  ORF type:complete len:397 (+),score=19.53 GCRY01008342.1:174-1193(+)